MDIALPEHDKLINLLSGLRDDRRPWWKLWRKLAQYYIPKRYIWLTTPNERKNLEPENSSIIDGTGTTAGRVLAAGMMNGITSPSRPWFRLSIPGVDDTADIATRAWLDEVERILLKIFAESNFYNALAIMYIDLVFFGTASVLIYEDYDSVIRCYNNALGEFYLGQSDRLVVDVFAREFVMTARQIEQKFGKENCSDTVKSALAAGGARLLESFSISHLIMPYDGNGTLPKHFKFREVYWETTATKGKILQETGYNEAPGIWPRWELTGNDSYGTGPALDALGDTVQLQHESRKKGQSLDYMNQPPMILDVALSHKPTALLPGGRTFVSNINNVGAKPAYQFTPPIGEMTLDIRDVQGRIREIFYNDLFKMISQLETVRSATEIDARREEKLVQLGPVLERFHNEALNPAINRTYQIAQRAKLIPPAPKTIEGRAIEIQYVSILAAAQNAVGAVPTERWVQFIGSLSAVYPKGINIPNWENLIRDYGSAIGVKAKNINPPDLTQQLNDQQDQAQAEQQGLASASVGADAAKVLSETQVGGGASALQRILGG